MSDHEDNPSERQYQQFYRFPLQLSAFEFAADVGHVEPTSDEPAYPTQDVPMRHAYVFVGTGTIFLCHQIMGFMQGHNYEVVLEVELPEEVEGYTVQRLGMAGLARRFEAEHGSRRSIDDLAILAPATAHYSMPEAASLLGLGTDNLVQVPVDERARMSVAGLESILDDRLAAETPVAAVVVVLGSTQESARTGPGPWSRRSPVCSARSSRMRRSGYGTS